MSDTPAPELTTFGMDLLIEVGKRGFDRTLADGQFFFPKVVYLQDDQLRVAQYDSDYNACRELCKFIGTQGPLAGISHTADSYFMDAMMTPPGVAERRQAGLVTNEELFQEGVQGLFEALSIVLVDEDLTTSSVYVPYVRDKVTGTSIEWLDVQYPPEWVATNGRMPRLLRATVRFSQSPRRNHE